MANIPGRTVVIHVSWKSPIHVSELSEIRALLMKHQGLLSHATFCDKFSCKNPYRETCYSGMYYMVYVSPLNLSNLCFWSCDMKAILITRALHSVRSCKVNKRAKSTYGPKRSQATLLSARFLSPHLDHTVLPIRCRPRHPASSAIKLSAVRNQGQATCHLASSSHQGRPASIPADNKAMLSHQLTHRISAPSGTLENEIIKMIASLHSAFVRLASKSKILFIGPPSSSFAPFQRIQLHVSNWFSDAHQNTLNHRI